MPVDAPASAAFPVAGFAEAGPGVTDPGYNEAQRSPIVTGLVLTLAADEPLAPTLRHALDAISGMRLGPQCGHWLPVTVETDDPRELHRQLEVIPGVRAVDVVFVEVVAASLHPAAHAAGYNSNVALPVRAGIAIE